MAIKAFPLEGEPMLDTEWEQIFHQLYRGVENGLVVSADGGGMRVFVSPGEGGTAGVGVVSDSQEQLSITSTGSARTAYVVLDKSAPFIKVRYSAANNQQYTIATVSVGANAVNIAPGDVTNVAKTPLDELADALGFDWSNLSGKPSVYPTSWAQVSGKPSTFAPSAHNHSASDITSGTLNAARIPTLAIGSKTSGFLPVSRVSGVGNETISTGNPSGGASGDKWFKV